MSVNITTKRRRGHNCYKIFANHISNEIAACTIHRQLLIPSNKKINTLIEKYIKPEEVLQIIDDKKSWQK